jgi:hypothetical protein
MSARQEDKEFSPELSPSALEAIRLLSAEEVEVVSGGEGLGENGVICW